METFLKFVILLEAIGLVLLVMVQRSKSGGGLGAMAGGASEQFFGADAGNMLGKMTKWLIAAFLVTVMLCHVVVLNNQADATGMSSEMSEFAEKQVTPETPVEETAAPVAESASEGETTSAAEASAE